MKKARLFALSTCPTCKKVKQFLEEHDIPREAIDVDTLESGEQWGPSKKLKKKATYPTLVIEEVLLGYDEDAMKKALYIG